MSSPMGKKIQCAAAMSSDRLLTTFQAMYNKITCICYVRAFTPYIPALLMSTHEFSHLARFSNVPFLLVIALLQHRKQEKGQDGTTSLYTWLNG